MQQRVSIPAGFSDALRPDSEGWEVIPEGVSIPAGFSDALRPAGCPGGFFP